MMARAGREEEKKKKMSDNDQLPLIERPNARHARPRREAYSTILTKDGIWSFASTWLLDSDCFNPIRAQNREW
jgi:hypothetical protein